MNENIPSLAQQARAAPVVTALVIFSLLGALLSSQPFTAKLFFQLTFLPFDGTAFTSWQDVYTRKEFWRLLTPAFLHFGFFHVLFNCLLLWDLGKRLEYYMGHVKFLAFFLLTAVCANLAEFLWARSSMFGGMSGFVYALLGYIAIRQKFSPHPLLIVPPGLIIFMLIWLVACMIGIVSFVIGSGIANAAHLGGLIFGGVYAALTLPPQSNQSEK